jgi:4-alpha-glucanotransferase
MKGRDQQFYLDLPIGSHAQGFDTWKHQSLFAHAIECGAPPDMVFAAGQAWGLPPMIPAQARATGYKYLRDVLQHHLSVANIVRIDHIIGLHRLYWVPQGFSARDGIFVQNNAEELYAILCLESHRNRAIIVGENLGTVPRFINAMMARHQIYETYVLQYEIPIKEGRSIRAPLRRSFAGLNTHDMVPFAGFLQSADVDELEKLEIRSPKDADDDRNNRVVQLENLYAQLETAGLLDTGDREPERVFQACVAFLKTSPAQYVVINLEDLWLEVKGHNIPGTSVGNWVRPSKRAVTDLPALQV